MTIKLALPDYAFPKLRWDQALRLISDLGVKAVDIGLFANRSHLRPEEMLRDPTKAAAHASSMLREHDLEVADVFGQPGTAFEEKAVNSPDAKERHAACDFFWRVLEFAARCNAKHVTFLPGVHFQEEEYESSLRRSAEELSWRVDAAARMGITMSVEPHIGSIISTPSLVRTLINRVPKLTLTLDYTHFTLQGIVDQEIEPLLTTASHFHARCACRDKLQCSFNENTIDYPRIVARMKEIGYSGYVVVEYVWTEFMHCNDVDILTETIQLRELITASG
jgi:sugar phosphate isomerase/epimerase